MKLSKNQIVMASIGGATLVAAAALGYLAFDAYSAKGEASEECEGASSTIQRLLRADVSPDKESELAFKKNCDTLSGWAEAALAAAAAGDRAIDAGVNEAAFKQRLVDEARELSQLSGGADGRIVKGDFTFGFPDFVTGDKLPEKARLPQLQRQWGDIKTLVETLQSCGVEEIVAIGAAEPTVKAKVAEDPKEARRNKKRKKAAEAEKPVYTVEKYAVDFRARPAALVKAVNALATSVRFVVVESMSFAREGDMIAAAIAEDAKASGAQQQTATTSRRRRRRRASPQEAEEQEAEVSGEQAKKSGVVTDPAKESPFLVKMVVSTYDFGSAANAAAPGNEGGSEKKEEEE